MPNDTAGCRMIVPDGSLQEVVHQLLKDAGIPVSYPDDRSYRPILDSRLFPPPFDIAVRMRPWDSPKVVADGRAELAFTGTDLVAEASCQRKVVVVDTYPLSRNGVGKTNLVLAVTEGSRIRGVNDLTPKHVVWTEYPRLARNYFRRHGVKPRVRTCHGSLEAFHDMADAILENTETGRSLEVNGWEVIERVMEAQTCLITHQAALENPTQAQIIAEVKLLLRSVIEGRQYRLVKCNVPPGVSLPQVLAMLPAAGVPTRSDLADDQGFALESVVDAREVENLIPRLQEAGAKAIVIAPISQYVP